MTDRLREALKHSDTFWDDYFDEKQDAMGEILDAARKWLVVTESDRLRVDLFTIWDRGRCGLSWDDQWAEDFVADLSVAVSDD